MAMIELAIRCCVDAFDGSAPAIRLAARSVEEIARRHAGTVEHFDQRTRRAQRKLHP